mmetsp:Transcript_62537/g.146672  ORF Transcript_62537/g.146672 Transcript_62537/m.146672 type:complete len:230 (+) Transcript_62537:1365-2054(+)
MVAFSDVTMTVLLAGAISNNCCSPNQSPFRSPFLPSSASSASVTWQKPLWTKKRIPASSPLAQTMSSLYSVVSSKAPASTESKARSTLSRMIGTWCSIILYSLAFITAVRWSMSLKTVRGKTQSLQSRVASTVAVRGSSYSSANSPKVSPILSTTSNVTKSTLSKPSCTTNNAVPMSPFLKTSLPCSTSMRCVAFTTWSHCSCVRPTTSERILLLFSPLAIKSLSSSVF